jgi:ABC-type multidrug transport system ATPase subunit
MDVEFRALEVERGGIRAVAAATGRLPHNCWTGLIGANGSGKTSLLRALAGRLPLAAGRIESDGEDRTAARPWRAAAIGFAPDVSALPGGLTGRQYLGLVRRTPAAGGGEARLARLAAALGFAPFADRPIAALSAGMRQRIAIFSAFADGAETVILDEPFNWLDPVCAFETREALRALIDGGQLTLVTALHEPSTLTVYCDGGLLMSEGRLIRELPREELRAGARDIAGFEASIIAKLRSAAGPEV